MNNSDSTEVSTAYRKLMALTTEELDLIFSRLTPEEINDLLDKLNEIDDVNMNGSENHE